MSYADKCFIETCKDILENGTSTEGEKVRPKWMDGTSAYTIKKFGVVHRYDLQKEFPAITIRKTALKSAMDEILWIYQKKSNNVHELNSHVWDQWTDKTGSIGKAYGYQIGKRFKTDIKCGIRLRIRDRDGDYRDAMSPLLHDEAIDNFVYGFKEYPSFTINLPTEYVMADKGSNPDISMDQMDYVLYQLKNTPFSRRIMTSLWNVSDLNEMNLQPCAWSVTYNVTEKDGEKYLNMFLNQRSQDMLAANNWNTAQYAILLMMVAQVCDMKPGELIHSIVDAHIYDRHIPIIKELITRPTYPAPKVWLDPDVKNFYDFTTDSLHVEDYEAGEQVKFEVAV